MKFLVVKAALKTVNDLNPTEVLQALNQNRT